MATSGSFMGSRTVTNGPQLRLLWDRTSVDIAGNRSKVKLTLQIYSQYSTYFSASKSGALEGSTFTYSGGMSGSGYKTIKTREIWVSHNNDGTKSFTADGYLNINISYGSGYVSKISVSGTISLDTIPRASKLNSFSVYNSLAPGNSCRLNLNITRYSSSFDHVIEVKYGSTTIATWSDQGTPSTLYLSSSQVSNLLSKMNTSTSGALTMVISTRSGSTRIGGYSSRKATATVNSSVKPSVSGLSASIYGSGFDKTLNKFVQNISRVSASFNASATGGAYLVTNRIYIRKDSNKGNEMTIHNNSGTSGTLSLNGTYEIIAESKDSRGRTTTSRITINVDSYSPPKITRFSAERSSIDDTVVNIERHGNYTSLDGKNITDIILQKRLTEGTWSNIDGGIDNHTGGSFGAARTNSGNSATLSYEFKLIISDSFGKITEATQTVSTAKVAFDIHKDEGVGIGKMHENGVLDVNGESHFKGDLIIRPNNYDSATKQSALKIMSRDPNGHAYFEWYGSDNTRKGYAGFYSPSSNSFVIETENDGNIDLRGRKIVANGEVISGGNEILWTGVQYMTASHVVRPSIPLAECPNGWLLIFSYYSGSPYDYNFNQVFIHKSHNALYAGQGLFANILYSGGSKLDASKYLYIHNDRIIGHESNNRDGAEHQVLRSVISW